MMVPEQRHAVSHRAPLRATLTRALVAFALLAPTRLSAQDLGSEEPAKKKGCCPAPLCVMPKDYQCIYGERRYPEQEDAAWLGSLGFRYFCGEKTRSCIGGRTCEKGEFVAYFCRRKGQKDAVTSERDLPKGFYLVRTDPPKVKDAGAPPALDASTGAIQTPPLPVAVGDAGLDGGIAPPKPAKVARKPEGSFCSVGSTPRPPVPFEVGAFVWLGLALGARRAKSVGELRRTVPIHRAPCPSPDLDRGPHDDPRREP